MMCLWLLLRTCKTSVMCLWLLLRTCKTSSLVDLWWCVCDFCWGLAKQRRCVSDFYRYEFAKQPHWLACGDVFVTSVENLQNIGDVFVTSVKNLQNILTSRLVVMCLWLLWGLAKQRRCVSDFYRYEFAKQPHWLACGDVFVTSVENLQNIDDVFVTSVKNLQNIGDVFVTSVKNLQNIHWSTFGDVFVTSVEKNSTVMCLWNIGDVFVTSVKNLQNILTGRLLVMCLWLLLRTCKTAAMCF